MGNIFLGFISIILVMLVLDAVWLGWLAKNFYRRGMSRAIVFEVRWWAAVLFYLLHAAGALYFGVSGGGTLVLVLLRGGFFGLATYGTYNLTNLATVQHWPVAVAALDMVWGSTMTMLAAAAAYGMMHAVQGLF